MPGLSSCIYRLLVMLAPQRLPWQLYGRYAFRVCRQAGELAPSSLPATSPILRCDCAHTFQTTPPPLTSGLSLTRSASVRP